MSEVHCYTKFSRKRGMGESTMPSASPEIIHARKQGYLAFHPSMLSDIEASAKCCPYSTPLFREAFHYGFTGASVQYLEALMDHLSDAMKAPFLKTITESHSVFDMLHDRENL